MKYRNLWRLSDAIELYSSVLQGNIKSVMSSANQFPLICTMEVTPELRPIHLRRLGKLVNEVWSAVCTDQTSEDLLDNCERLLVYNKALNERELHLTPIDAMRTLYYIDCALAAKTAWKKSTVQLYDQLLDETRKHYQSELSLCSEQIRIIKFGDREQDAQTDFLELRLDTYPRIWHLSTCPPTILTEKLISESISVFRQGMDMEQGWMDSFYPIVSLESSLWDYFSIRWLDEFLSVADTVNTVEVVRSLEKVCIPDSQYPTTFLDDYRALLQHLCEFLTAESIVQTPLMTKVAIDFAVPYLRVAHLKDLPVMDLFSKKLKKLSTVLECYSRYDIESFKSLGHSLEATYGEASRWQFSDLLSYLDAITRMELLDDFSNMGSIFGTDARDIQLPTTEVHQLFRDSHVELWEMTSKPVSIDVWGERGYLKADSENTLWGGRKLSQLIVPIPEGWHYSLMQVNEIALGEDWEDWNKNMSAHARSSFESYVIGNNPPKETTFRDFVYVRFGSLLERNVVARRVILAAFLYHKRRAVAGSDPHELLKKSLRYDLTSESNYRGHRYEIGLTMKFLSELVLSTSKLWPGEEAWVRGILKEYK